MYTFMREFKTYLEAEEALCRAIVAKPDFITATTFEKIGLGFILTQPWNNENTHSNYDYARKFFAWLTTGEKELSDELIQANPWVKRFVSKDGLPDSFSASYGWKIKEQMPTILSELRTRGETRRAYINVLYPQDNVILFSKTTHEYPCTIGFQFFIRDSKLIMIVNMRSNNVYAVMPYDVFNFTSLQYNVAEILGITMGNYYHQINNAHLYKGDVRRLKEQYYL